MKKILPLLAVALLMACQNKDATESQKTLLDTTTFPYQIKNYGQWQMNLDQKNVTVAMNAVKAFASLDTAALKPLLGDSVHLTIDGYEFKGTKSQFLQVAQEEMSKYKRIRIEMMDMESVMSRDKKTEYVSLWYKQFNETKDGKMDSIKLFNDFKIKNGKVLEWEEYAQHYMQK